MTAPAILLEESPVNTATAPKTWAVDRASGIGGSEAAAVLGVSPWTSPLDLYLRKVGLAPEFETTEVMEWGNRLEPVVLEKFREESGYLVTPGDEADYLHRHPVDEFMIGHVDGIFEKPGGEIGVLEVKTTSAYGKADWEEEAPAHYQIQLQHYMHVVGADHGAFAVLIGGNCFRWYEVRRNERFVSALVNSEREFWERIKSEDPPPATAGDSAALGILYPEEMDAEPAILPAEASDWDEALRQAKVDIKDAEKRKSEAEALLKAAIGESAFGVLPGAGRYSWKTTHRKEKQVEAHTRPASSYRVLRRLKK